MRRLLIAFLLACFVCTLIAQLPQAVVSPKDWVMAPEAASAYLKHEVQPFLEKALIDRTYPSGISGRINTLFTAITKGKIDYEAEPFYHPVSKTLAGHVEFLAPGQTKPKLMFFVPTLRDTKQEYKLKHYPDSRFELGMAILFAHEEVHVELKHAEQLRANPTLALAVRQEAQAWGITILEMIRPALAQNRWMPENYKHNSDEFKKVGDNWQDPRWIAIYNNYYDH